jgi:hypothetical protein
MKRNDMALDQKDSPFLLVEHGKDGLWHVHERRFDTSGVLFNERQDACDYASERARTKKDSMVLIREHQSPDVNTDVPAKLGVMARLLSWTW